MAHIALLLTAIAFPLAGCSVGGQYGYSLAVSQPPGNDVASNAPNTGYNQIMVVNPVRPPAIRPPEFAAYVRGFLEAEMRKCHQQNSEIQELGAGGSADFLIINIKSCVIRGGSEWERLQFSFIGSDRGTVPIVVAGQLAPGLRYPLDSQFRSMEPEHVGDLIRFNQILANDFTKYRSGLAVQ